MSAERFTIGVDFGSDSARAALVRTSDGAVAASVSAAYARWGRGLYSDASAARFRQHPLDYREALRAVLHGVLDGFAAREAVVGIGVDATASTPCLTDAAGAPLALRPAFADDPDAMFLLWKDHTAAEEARRITDAARASGADYCRPCGGTYSPENGWAKIWHVLATNPAVAGAAASVTEQGDWLTSLLTGGPVPPSYAAAAYKMMWHASWGGYPPEGFFAALGGERLAAVRRSLVRRPVSATAAAGRLARAWADELGLRADVVVSAGNIDAHSGAVGAGCGRDVAAHILGTSGCVLCVAPQEDFGGRAVSGVFGQAPDGIVEGLEGFEAGLASFGDGFAWVARLVGETPAALDRMAAALTPDGATPVATDWFNGRRSPQPDAAATATLGGLTLGTDAARLYYAVVEAAAFGVRAVLEHLAANGVRAARHVAVGGIARKSPFVMQMLADATGRTFEVSSAENACALGAAIHAAVAAGLHPDVAAAQRCMCAPPCAVYAPRPGRDHDARYARYTAFRQDGERKTV